MTKGIRTFRIYRNNLEMWMRQNKAEYTGNCVKGNLLDNFMVSTPYGYAFFKEIALNEWSSCYEITYCFDRKSDGEWKPIYDKVWDMWYDFEFEFENAMV